MRDSYTTMGIKLLAIDTAESACSAALMVDGEVRSRMEQAARGHSERILPMMQSLLSEAGCSLNDLDTLAFGRGPGSFTGLRIAAGVIQGSALGAGLPVVPVSTLRALAQGAFRMHGARQVLSALDARMAEVYWGAYALDGKDLMQPLIDELVCAPEAVPVAGKGELVWRRQRLAGLRTGSGAACGCNSQPGVAGYADRCTGYSTSRCR